MKSHEVIVSNKDFEIVKVDIQKENYDSYLVRLQSNQEEVGLIQIEDAISRDLEFNFKNQEYIVESCNLLLNHLKENGYDYVTFKTSHITPEMKEILKGLQMRYKYSFQMDEHNYRLYQTSVKPNIPYTGYWDQYPHYIESSELK